MELRYTIDHIPIRFVIAKGHSGEDVVCLPESGHIICAAGADPLAALEKMHWRRRQMLSRMVRNGFRNCPPDGRR